MDEIQYGLVYLPADPDLLADPDLRDFMWQIVDESWSEYVWRTPGAILLSGPPNLDERMGASVLVFPACRLLTHNGVER